MRSGFMMVSFNGSMLLIICDNLKEAVELIKKSSKKGDVAVMSPACASFDKYKNFEERGRLFKKYVNEE